MATGVSQTRTERQRLRPCIQNSRQFELSRDLVDPRADAVGWQAEQTGMEFEVLADCQFRVERESLRHVTDAPPDLDVPRIDFATKKHRPAIACVQKTGKHLHGGRLAATVRSDEAENLAAAYAEAGVVDGREVAEALGQVLGLDRRLAVGVRRPRRNDDLPVSFTFCGWQQGNEGCVEFDSPGTFQQFGRSAGSEHPPAVHGDKPVEAGGLLHVGRGHDNAHAFAAAPYPPDQLPELPTREWIDAGGRLVEDQEVRVMDERAAKTEFLLHAP